MKVLVSGAMGFLGQGLTHALEPHHELRLLDVVEQPTEHELIVGSVSDFALCQRAMRGVDAVVIGHMAPRDAGLYDTPNVPFEVNVAGTVNLYRAAIESGVRRAILISSITVVKGHQDAGTYLTRDLAPMCTTHPYGLTKMCQESIAHQFHLFEDMATAILRPAYITDADQKLDKYGRDAIEANWQYIDRRDVGKAAHRALTVPDLGCEIFYVMGHPDVTRYAEMEPTRTRLRWTPDHPFT